MQEEARAQQLQRHLQVAVLVAAVAVVVLLVWQPLQLLREQPVLPVLRLVPVVVRVVVQVPLLPAPLVHPLQSQPLHLMRVIAPGQHQPQL